MDWSVGGVAVASAAVATVAVARFAKWRVNCWFCNENQWVPVRDRRHFMCKYCTQYNGFTEDGGYDRIIREQHRIIPTKTRYATTSGSQSTLSDSPFCTRCEDAMERRRRAVADWEPINEEDWKEEYDEYTRRMERVYPLCVRCEMNTQRRLTANKQKYKYLQSLAQLSSKAGSILSGLTSVSRMAVRKGRRTSRRRFFSGGSLTTTLHLMGMMIAGVLMLTLTDRLVSDCGMAPLPLSRHVRWGLSLILPHAFHLALIATLTHAFSFAINKNRISLPDLLSIPFLIWLIVTLNAPLEGDNALQSVAASSSLFLLLAAVAVLPRKRKHRKRPNDIINSAFSVASTPVSQVSSQADSFLLPSPRDENWSPVGKEMSREEDRMKTPSFRQNGFTRFRERNVLNTPDEMDWEESTVSSVLSASPTQKRMNIPRSPLSTLNGMGGWRESRREETPDRSTPAREIASQLSAFSMRDEHEDEEDGRGMMRRNGGPFPSASSHFGVQSMNGDMYGGLFRQNGARSTVSFHSHTPSLSRVNSLVPPSMARFHSRSSPSVVPSVAHSHLTSASQQMSESRCFYYLILILTFTSVLTFVGMSILFYHTFFR